MIFLPTKDTLLVYCTVLKTEYCMEKLKESLILLILRVIHLTVWKLHSMKLLMTIWRFVKKLVKSLTKNTKALLMSVLILSCTKR